MDQLGLLEIRANHTMTASLERLRALLNAVPAISLLSCGVHLSLAELEVTLPMLRNTPQYDPLRITSVLLSNYHAGEDGLEDDLSVFCVAAALHSPLTNLYLNAIPLDDAALQMVVDLAVSKPLSRLVLWNNQLGPESLPQVTRLLSAGSLSALTLADCVALFQIEGETTAFCNALRSAKLRTLKLKNTGLGASVSLFVQLLCACVGHTTLKKLDLSLNRPGNAEKCAAVGHVLALVVDSGLESLELLHCDLGDSGLAPLFAGVARSSRLLSLKCSYEDVSAACARDVILPAVQANASLRKLHLQNGRTARIPEMNQAVALVALRSGV